MSRNDSDAAKPSRIVHRIHAVDDLVPPDALEQLERRLEQLARERPDLLDYVSRMSGKRGPT